MALFGTRRRHPEEVAAILAELALLARWSRRGARATHLEQAAERLRADLRASPVASWGTRKHKAVVEPDSPRWLTDLLDRLRTHGRDEVEAALHRLPPVVRGLARAALDHPVLAGALESHDLLLHADLDRLAAADDLETLVSDAPPAGVPLGRAWLQSATAIDELTALAAMPVSWQRAGGLRRVDPVIDDLVVVAATDDPRTFVRTVTEALPETAVGFVGHEGFALATEPEPLVVHAVQPRALSAALLWYSGPRPHVAALRARAAAHGLTLTRDSLTRNGSPLTLGDEDDLYIALDLAPIPVELRHRPGIVDKAARGELPPLIEVADIRGDLHTHTVWSDGRDSMTRMAHGARALGYRYLAITDHSPTARASRVLTLERLARQADEVAEVRAAFPDLTILHGIELDIQADGSLDVPDRVLATLDIVLASLHQGLGHDGSQLLARYVAAARHPLVNVLTHPANRAPGRLPGYDLDYDRLFAVAAETGTAVEIDGAPGHLDLDAPLAERAAALGATLVVNSDCHIADRLGRQMTFGVGLARRAALQPRHVLNTSDVDAVRAFVAAKRAGRRW